MDKQLDTLLKYGTPFQLKTITCLIKYPEFLEQIRDLVNIKYYESESQQWIVKATLKYFDEYKKSPTLDVFKIEMDSYQRGTKGFDYHIVKAYKR